MAETMTKTERAELRSIVRQQFKVLRSEIEQRKAELVVELNEEIRVRFAEEDARRSVVSDRIREVQEAAERQITDMLLGEGLGITVQRPFTFGPSDLRWPTGDRMELRRQGAAAIEARVRDAKVRLERQEADLLRSLAVDAIESDAAKSFLGSIPTVGELVPSARLMELGEGVKADG